MEKITSRHNPLCVHIKKLGVNRKYRQSSGQFLCDGLKLLEEAADADAEIVSVLTATQIPFPLPLGARVYYTDRSLIDSLSPLKNAQDILFTCNIPNTGQELNTSTAHILLDSVSDPGNVGTIIRTAYAFGIGSVILTGECADPYNPKTVRATMGAVFKQRIHTMSFSELAGIKKKSENTPRGEDAGSYENGVTFIGAALGDDCLDISSVGLGGAIIAVGSEGRGLSDEILSLCDKKVMIPIAPGCESLNAAVAAAIAMWEAGRSRSAGGNR